MGIRQSVVNRPKRLTAANPEQIRAYLGQFSKKHPALVTDEVYKELSRRPDLRDLMERVKVSEKAPKEEVHREPDASPPSRPDMFKAFQAGWDAANEAATPNGPSITCADAWKAFSK